MRRFFNAESGIWKVFGYLADLLILSMLWTLCCVPLITAGAASCALYDAVAADFRRHETDYLRRFFRTLKREFLASLLPALACAAVLVFCWWVLRSVSGGSLWLTAIVQGVLLLPLGIVCWVFPLQSRFTLDFGRLCGNALRLALGHAPSTFAMGIGLVLSLWLTLRLGLLPLFFLPALLALYMSVFLEPVFRQYESTAEK